MSINDSFEFRRNIRNAKNTVVEIYKNFVQHADEHPKNTAIIPLCHGLERFIQNSTEFWISLLEIKTEATDRSLTVKFSSGLNADTEPNLFLTFHYEILDGVPSIVNRSDEATKVIEKYLEDSPDEVWNFLFIPLALYKWYLDEGWNYIDVIETGVNQFTFVVLDPEGCQKVTLTFDLSVSKLDNDYMLSRIGERNDD